MKGCIGSPYKPVECAAKFLNQVILKKNRISKSQSTINAPAFRRRSHAWSLVGRPKAVAEKAIH